MNKWVDAVLELAKSGRVLVAGEEQDLVAQISEEGTRKISLMTLQCCPHVLAEPRDQLALTDMTRLELMVVVNREFAWRLLPNTSQRTDLTYNVMDKDSPKCWYTHRSGLASHSYLLCLLHADRLHTEYQLVIPHHLPRAEEQYAAMLNLHT